MSNASDVQHILVVSDSKSRRIVPLTESLYSIGRNPKTNILLRDRQVSRHHATLLQVAENQSDSSLYRIIDGDLQGKKSTNGITVNGEYCLSHDLQSGDQIRFGPKCCAKYQIITNFVELDVLKAGNNQGKNIPDSQPLKNSSLETSTVQLAAISEQSLLKTVQPNIIKTVFQESALNNQSHLIDIAQGNPNPIIEINFQGEITYLNIPAQVKFQDLDQSLFTHPIFQGLIGESFAQRGTYQVREVQVNQKFFEQHIHYLEEKKAIRIYLFDITKYKKREEKLNTIKDRYRLFVEQGTEGILLVNRETQCIIEANQAYCQLLGYASAEIIGLSLYQLIELDQAIINQELQAVKPETPYIVREALHRHRDGSLINVAGKISQTAYQGQDIFCYVVKAIGDRKVINITSRFAHCF